jgi:hypothetical protein
MKLQISRKALLALIGVMAWTAPALAIPELQLYIEGATYDNSTQTWVTNSSNFKLWVVGDVSKKGTILDVHIAAAFLTSEAGNGTISLTRSTTSLVTDPSLASIPVLNLSKGADGTIPVMDDGRQLPQHGTYGAGVSWNQFDIGDLSLTDSPIGDLSTSFPGSFPDQGQINVYDVAVSGFSSVHFDAFNHVQAGRRAMSIKAPFSHDAAGTPSVPEPASLLLLGFGIGGSALLGLRRRVKR